MIHGCSGHRVERDGGGWSRLNGGDGRGGGGKFVV